MTRRKNGEDDRSYPISKHARDQLVRRWPETVFQPRDFSTVTVPIDARRRHPRGCRRNLSYPRFRRVSIEAEGLRSRRLQRSNVEET